VGRGSGAANVYELRGWLVALALRCCSRNMRGEEWLNASLCNVLNRSTTHHSATHSCHISILILASNKCEYTRRGLQSLFSSSLRPFQVVLVDNGSTDDTPRVFDEFERHAAGERIDVKRLRFESNIGAIAGRNRGMEAMDGRDWVFLDNDIVVRSRGWMERLRAELERDAQVVVGPKLVYPVAPHDIQCAGCDVTPGGQRFRSVGAGGALRRQVQRAARLPDPDQRYVDDARRCGKDWAPGRPVSPVQFGDIDYCYRFRSWMAVPLHSRCRDVSLRERDHQRAVRSIIVPHGEETD
jgi:glycosyltransferase involved in cell wall biosynthesis